MDQWLNRYRHHISYPSLSHVAVLLVFEVHERSQCAVRKLEIHEQYSWQNTFEYLRWLFFYIKKIYAQRLIVDFLGKVFVVSRELNKNCFFFFYISRLDLCHCICIMAYLRNSGCEHRLSHSERTTIVLSHLNMPGWIIATKCEIFARK